MLIKLQKTRFSSEFLAVKRKVWEATGPGP